MLRMILNNLKDAGYQLLILIGIYSMIFICSGIGSSGNFIEIIFNLIYQVFFGLLLSGWAILLLLFIEISLLKLIYKSLNYHPKIVLFALFSISILLKILLLLLYVALVNLTVPDHKTSFLASANDFYSNSPAFFISLILSSVIFLYLKINQILIYPIKTNSKFKL